MVQTDLSVTIGSLRLKNPVMPASGTYGYLDENAHLFPMDVLGAIVPKSVHYLSRDGNPMPRIAEVTGGMLNAVGIPSKGLAHFMEHELAPLSTLGAPIVLSIAGTHAEEYALAVRQIGDDPRIAALELNLSCPNVGTGLAFSSDTAVLSRVLSDVRPLTKLTLIAKLTPNVTNICAVAKAAEVAGADALVIANTFFGMKIDIEKQAPVLGNQHGGVSGACIKPLALYQVYHAYEAVGIPIIGCGGICTWCDAVEYLLAGAAAVQVGSANFANPNAMPQVIAGIDAYLAAHGYGSVREIVGKAH